LDLPHVAMNFGRARLQSLEGDFLQGMGYRRKVATWSSSFVALPQLVVGTDRIATIPRLLADQLVRLIPVKILDSPIDFPEISEVMQWHQYRANDPGVAWLRSVLHEAARHLKAGAPTDSLATEAGSTSRRRLPRRRT
jgi:LysR family transcriptional regulator, nod-box dependent transcriptional activator